MIFPLFMLVTISFDKADKKLRVKISLFGFTVFKLYAKYRKNRIIIRRTFKKPYSVKVKKIFSSSGNMMKLKGVSLLRVNSIINVGLTGDVFYPFLAINALSVAENQLFFALKTIKPSIKTNGTINVYDSDCFFFFLQIHLIFNLFIAIINIVSLLTEKIFKNAN